MSDPNIETQLDLLLSNFNFHDVWRVMVMLDWKYESLGRTPNLGEIQDFAEGVLREAIKDDCTAFSGGFEATYDAETQYMGLKFYIESVFSRPVEDKDDDEDSEPKRNLH